MTGSGGSGGSGVPALTNLLRGGVERLDRRDEREFLPAALEILETPPSPTGRALAIIIGAFFVIAVAWATFGRVDVLATAPGRLLPSGRSKVIQPLDEGLVRAIKVQDGDHVTAGQSLIELDPTSAGADSHRLSHEVSQAACEVARLTALKHATSGGGPAVFVAPAGADPSDVEQARAALRAQLDEQAAKLADYDQQIAAKQAEIAQSQAEIAKTNGSLPTLTEKERLHRTLREQGYGTSFAYLDAQQQVSEARNDLVILAAHASQARAAAGALERERAEARSQFAAGVLADLEKAEARLNEATQDLVKASQKSDNTTLRAPIDGVVEDLAVHTVGGVVTPAQPLMTIVPDNQALMVEAQLANRDVGFVRPGQDVAVKIETFNFTRYGLLHGKVINVSRDVAPTAERPPPGAAPAAPPPPAGSPTYVARIRLDKDFMMIDGHRQALLPGMAVTAEVRTGNRTILDYLLSPLSKQTDEALHER